MTAAFLREVKNSKRMTDPLVFFDVGANEGQTVREMREAFSGVIIHALEPALSTYKRLTQKHEGDNAPRLYQITLDRNDGEAKFRSNYGTGNHIIKGEAVAGSFEFVQALTGDSFCRSKEIDRIDFLKIDTEGFDLDVLAGFADMLRTRRIEYV